MAKSKFLKGIKNKIRVGLQIVILLLIGYVAAKPVLVGIAADFEAYCPFGGLASLGSKLNQGTMSCNMSEVQMFLGIGLLVGIVLVGKLFCGFLCPVGSVSEWLAKIGEKLHIRFEMPKKIDRPLRLLKYGLLFATLYITMTTSELFCKEYDPFYAVVNLFGNTDIYLYFAIPAVILTVVGSIMTRLFWCKYLCPLSALSNVFMNVAGAGAVIILFVVLRLAGVDISYVWLALGLVLSGLITEVGFMRSFLSPLPKITRIAETCTDCGLCDKYCPQGIEVSKYVKVDHIDCTLCTDCVYACPIKNSVTVAKQKPAARYWIPAAVIAIVLLSLGASSQFEFTTIAERWNNFDSVKTIANYKQSGLKNIKCYGSSMTLKGKLESIDGIYGLDTYARSHTVNIYYNPNEITEKEVKATLFTPTKQKIRSIKSSGADSVAVFTVGVNELFDAYDFLDFANALKTNKNIFGFESEYGEPVKVTIFYDGSKAAAAELIAAIEQKEIEVTTDGKTETKELKFECDGSGEAAGYISTKMYEKRLFRPYNNEYDAFESYEPSVLSQYQFPMPEADNASLRRFLGWLASHLSADEGIVRFQTKFTDEPLGVVWFDPKKTDEKKIETLLAAPKLKIFSNETKFVERDNPYKIDVTKGKTEKPVVAEKTKK